LFRAGLNHTFSLAAAISHHPVASINFVLTDQRAILKTPLQKAMTTNPDKSQGDFAKIMAACVRRGYLEKLHAGITPVTRTGDYSDVKVIDAEGLEIPWNQVSRINQSEMKMLVTGVLNRLHTFLARTFYCGFQDKAFQQALERAAAPWTKTWDAPQYLPEFLMPTSDHDPIESKRPT
jgi:hypothetical protein